MYASYLNQTEYTPVGDIAVMMLCYAFGLFLLISRTQKDRNYRLTVMMIVLSLLSAVGNIVYRMLLGMETLMPISLYISRLISHSIVSLVQIAYILFLREPLWLKNEKFSKFTISVVAVSFAPVLIDMLGIIFGFGFHVENNTVSSTLNIYIISYAAYLMIVLYLLIRYRERMIHKVFIVMIILNVFSLMLVSMQGMFHQTSFSTLAYFLPVTGIVYLFHSNPYDTDTGAVTDKYFYDDLNSSLEKNTPTFILSCWIPEFYNLIKNNSDFRREFFRFFRHTMRKGVLYRFPNDKMILMIKKKGKVDYNKFIHDLLGAFIKSYGIVGVDYKIVVTETVPELKKAAEYVRFISYIEDNMDINSTHLVSEEDVKSFHSDTYILSQLDDIVRQNDLDDSRVLVYCQPVFNIVTGTYDTAEALMRLKLPETGMVFPDKFIPLAEKTNTIHTLTMIILNKTCGEISRLLSEGYILNRISVNFSTLDLRRKKFRSEVQDIIESHEIPYNKIAIEITESRSELEFNQMKQKVSELQSLGIKFYLDDFGTGYSNFERIMEIPFDIIKFDRSLLIESVKNDSSKFMVSTFANMFNQLNYSVLFEGVEDDRDEKHCVGMHASYLQGYKYSRPIPIGELRNFLAKDTA